MGRQRQRKLELPRWCLVVDDIHDLNCLPRCVPIGYAEHARRRNTLVAVEDAELTGLTTYFEPYMKPRSEPDRDEEDTEDDIA